jgi:hypothetical protein
MAVGEATRACHRDTDVGRASKTMFDNQCSGSRTDGPCVGGIAGLDVDSVAGGALMSREVSWRYDGRRDGGSTERGDEMVSGTSGNFEVAHACRVVGMIASVTKSVRAGVRTVAPEMSLVAGSRSLGTVVHLWGRSECRWGSKSNGMGGTVIVGCR